MIDLYCGINETRWNHHPVAPGPLACIAPVYGRTERTRKENRVSVPEDTKVLQDSGAFSDGPSSRLTLQDALKRQIAHAAKWRYAHQVEGVASYDLLIDEKWQDGVRYKARWSESEAQEAIDTTIKAAKYLVQHRYALPYNPTLVLSAQGVTPEQYLDCTCRVLWHGNWEKDILGLGGWCISGKMPKRFMPVFYETMRQVIPLVGQSGVKRVHIWGVLYAPALGTLLWLCDKHGIKLSTDSAGPSVRPCFGEWGYLGWREPYQQPSVAIRGLERARHVQAKIGRAHV